MNNRAITGKNGDIGRQRAIGFTMIELLVVIGIIALLVAIMTPSLQGVLQSAKITKCKKNLADIGKSIIGYAQVNNDYVTPGSYGSVDSPSETWATILMSKRLLDAPVSAMSGVPTTANSVLQCPDARPMISKSAPQNLSDMAGQCATETDSNVVKGLMVDPNYQYVDNWYGANGVDSDANGYPMNNITGTNTQDAAASFKIRSVQFSAVARPGDTILVFDGWGLHNTDMNRISPRHLMYKQTAMAAMDGQATSMDRYYGFPDITDANTAPRFNYVHH